MSEKYIFPVESIYKSAWPMRALVAEPPAPEFPKVPVPIYINKYKTKNSTYTLTCKGVNDSTADNANLVYVARNVQYS